MSYAPDTLDLLRLALTPSLGPARIARLLERFGSPRAVLDASPADLAQIKSIGPATAARVAAAFATIDAELDRELALADRLSVRLIPKGSDDYPALLAELPDAPPLLYVRGPIARDSDPYPVAIVGSRRCTPYGLEQADRFASILAQAGLTIVSGGARGIDSAAHRGALRAQARTIAVVGSGLANIYPPENASLFDDVVSAGGAILSELPLLTPPNAENFPARNRIISGLSLGVLVIEAGKGSGALITARQAAEDHGREVMALPGRVDSPASEGSLDLIKSGGAALVTNPHDVVALLESHARHAHAGTHAHRFHASPTPDPTPFFHDSTPPAIQDPNQRAIWNALTEPKTLDELCSLTQLDPASVRSLATLMEIEGRLARVGPRLCRST